MKNIVFDSSRTSVACIFVMAMISIIVITSVIAIDQVKGRFGIAITQRCEIVSMESGGGAQIAGLEIGDRILSVNGDQSCDYRHVFVGEKLSSSVTVVLRDGKKLTYNVVMR